MGRPYYFLLCFSQLLQIASCVLPNLFVRVEKALCFCGQSDKYFFLYTSKNERSSLINLVEIGIKFSRHLKTSNKGLDIFMWITEQKKEPMPCWVTLSVKFWGHKNALRNKNVLFFLPLPASEMSTDIMPVSAPYIRAILGKVAMLYHSNIM